MSGFSKETETCCQNPRNVIRTESGYVCMICGIVLDMHIYTSISVTPPLEMYTKDELILEYCERGNIDYQTSCNAESLYLKTLKKHPRLQKNSLRASCIY